MSQLNTRRRFGRRSRQHGYSLVELGIVLLIIAVILGAVLAKSYFTKSNANSQDEESVISAVLSAMPNYKVAGSYGAAGTSLVGTLVTAGVIPKNWSITGAGAAATVANRWGGAFTVVSTGNGFTITDAGLPDDVCAAVAGNVSTSGGNGGTLTTQINGAAFTGATQCNKGAAGDTISFTSTN